MMSEWVNQGSLFERQQRLQAGAMVQSLADEMNFTPEQRRDMSQKVYDLLADGVSQATISRSMQQRTMSNQYYWSAAAYESGNPELALMDKDQPWLPRIKRRNGPLRTGGTRKITPRAGRDDARRKWV